MRPRVELDVIFEKYVHVTQLGTNLKNVTLLTFDYMHTFFPFIQVLTDVQSYCWQYLILCNCLVNSCISFGM